METTRDLKYCGWVLAFFALSACCWFGLVRLQVGAPTDTSKALDAIVRYKAGVASRVGKPKLVLVGASGTYHSILAETIHRETGMPTVNMGFTAGLGSRYLMENAKRSLEPGDTVLLTLEYVLLFRGGIAPYALDYFYSRDPAYLSTLPLGERMTMPLQMSPYRLAFGLVNRIRPLKLSNPDPLRYTRELGDGVYARSEPTEADRALVGQQFDFDPEGPDPAKLADVADFARWCKAHGVRLVLSYPAIARMPDLDTAAAKSFLAKLEVFYESTGAMVEGRPEDFYYDRSWFQDSRLHLTLGASERHTLERVRFLRGLFGKATSPGK